MKRKRSLIALSIAAALIGIVSTFIPWGDPDGFHGQGFPVASVMWDKASNYYEHPAPSDGHIDFPNPLAIILNPIIYWILFLTLWGMIEGILFLIRRARRQSQAD